MQQRSNPARIIKFFTRLVPCATVIQADTPNFYCEPHLCDLTFHQTHDPSPNYSEACLRGQPPLWEPLAESSWRLHLLPCSAGAACLVSNSCRRNTNLQCSVLAGKQEERLPKRDYPVSFLVSHVLV